MKSIRTVIVIMWYLCACSAVDNIGRINVPDSDNRDSRMTSVSSDTGDHLVDFSLTDTAPLFFRMDWISSGGNIAADSNWLGLPGQWYSFADDNSTRGFIDSGDGEVCADGVISPVTNGSGYSGIGFHLCNSGPDGTPAYERFTIAQCPFVDNLETRLLGVSFEISGALPDDLKLQFMELNRVGDVYIPVIDGGRRDYFFTDAQLPDSNPTPLNTANMNLVQWEMRNYGDVPLDANFCIKDVQLLVSP